jgi:hypothetical protein
MPMFTRPLIEDRPPIASNRTIFIVVAFEIIVISLLLFIILLLPIDVHADYILRLLNSD